MTTRAKRNLLERVAQAKEAVRAAKAIQADVDETQQQGELTLDDIRQILGERGYRLQVQAHIVRRTGQRGPEHVHAYKIRDGSKGPSRSLGKLEDLSRLDEADLVALVRSKFGEGETKAPELTMQRYRDSVAMIICPSCLVQNFADQVTFDAIQADYSFPLCPKCGVICQVGAIPGGAKVRIP